MKEVLSIEKCLDLMHIIYIIYLSYLMYLYLTYLIYYDRILGTTPLPLSLTLLINFLFYRTQYPSSQKPLKQPY